MFRHLITISLLFCSTVAFAEYQPEWINRLEQMGYTDYTLVLTDDEEIMPTVRVDKNFQGSVSLDSETLIEEAEAEILKAIEEYEASQNV